MVHSDFLFYQSVMSEKSKPSKSLYYTHF